MISIVSVPYIVFLSIDLFDITYVEKEVSMLGISLKMFFVVTVPVIIGMIIRKFFSDFIENNIKIRQSNFKRQTEFFKRHSKYFITPHETEFSNTAWLAFPIQLRKNTPFSRKEFQIFLEKRNIQTRVVFTGNITRQPMCSNIDMRVSKEGYPNADRVMEKGVLLPVHHGLTESMFDRFHSTIETYIKQF